MSGSADNTNTDKGERFQHKINTTSSLSYEDFVALDATPHKGSSRHCRPEREFGCLCVRSVFSSVYVSVFVSPQTRTAAFQGRHVVHIVEPTHTFAALFHTTPMFAGHEKALRTKWGLSCMLRSEPMTKSDYARKCVPQHPVCIPLIPPLHICISSGCRPRPHILTSSTPKETC